MPTDFAEALHEALLGDQLTIATAESCTVGRVMAHLGSCSGSSAYFKGGVCAYTKEAKVNILGVDNDHATEVKCFSARVAEEMAEGVAKLFGADIGISTTGYAEPNREGGILVPQAWVGLCFEGECHSAQVVLDEDFALPGMREVAQKEITHQATRFLLSHLFGIDLWDEDLEAWDEDDWDNADV